MQSGARSGRLPVEQLRLRLEALEQTIAKHVAEAEGQDPGLRGDNSARWRANRGGLPAHLPRVDVTLRLVAHVAMSRYADHEPRYRQAQMLRRRAIIIDRSILSF